MVRLMRTNEIITLVQLLVGMVVTINSYRIFIVLLTAWCGLSFRRNLLLVVMAKIWGRAVAPSW